MSQCGFVLPLAVRRPSPPIAYSDDGDRRFRFIVTGLERGEVLLSILFFGQFAIGEFVS
jgi:hypothetical protein